MPESLRIGIDVGGTNTDGVLLNTSDRVLAKVKTPTTADVLWGVRNAIAALLASSGAALLDVQFAMLSTTACTNAITTREDLVPIALLRLGAPATTAIPPLTTWPQDLRDKVLVEQRILRGGHEFHGGEIVPLDEAGVREAAQALHGRVGAIAIAGVFSPLNPTHEERAMAIVREELGPEIPVTLSHEIGSLNLIERENASALNAALTRVAHRVVHGFQGALRDLGLAHVHAYLGQNDGTLMSLEMGLRFPVLTIACGPANSIRGAARLSGVREGMVIDIGGTTSDLGVLVKGFPRESTAGSEVGGVRTNFRMPDLLSIGLGGGSRVHTSDAGLTVGPDTVGARLRECALVFGGTELIATDLAVAAGRACIGDPERVRHLSPQLVAEGMNTICNMLANLIDRMKFSGEDVRVVVAGGGSILLPNTLPGVSEVLRPEHYEVANAVGVATAQLSASADQVFALATTNSKTALDIVLERARRKLLEAGARMETVEILELEELPVPYMAADAFHVRVKLAATLAGL
jgi:N-methylhydantoinase A/oxoprolinase/acetone carboxylase beta subunit